MFKKTTSIFLALVLLLSLSACGHEHQWTEATCAAPKTCADCGETEGETLSHNWTDATCSAPKTCTVCGATEGEALEHTWIPANLQQPQTCSVCNTTEGEPLITYFEEHGLDERLLDMSGEYTLPLTCYENQNETTFAKVTVEDYKTITSDDAHEALEGYEWKVMNLKLLLDDENAQKYGFMGHHYLWSNRYEEAVAEEEEEDKEDDGVINELFIGGMEQTFQWKGVEYEDGWIRINEANDGWMMDLETGVTYFEIRITVSVRMPVGHDEFVLGLESSQWEWPEGTYLHEAITDDTLLFRFY